jgi:hypothetical protein
MLAPFADPGWLIYACSPDNTPGGHSPDKCLLPRVDEWFEIHNPVFDATRPYAYLEYLANIPKVWMRDKLAMTFRTQDGRPLFPTAQVYPEKALKDRFGPYAFTSTVAFMMAKAVVDIEEMVRQGRMGPDGYADGEPPQIGLWGILQNSKREYEEQRAGTQQMIWNAAAAGIKVQVAAESGLLQPPQEKF